jgi:hypothetical protein
MICLWKATRWWMKCKTSCLTLPAFNLREVLLRAPQRKIKKIEIPQMKIDKDEVQEGVHLTLVRKRFEFHFMTMLSASSNTNQGCHSLLLQLQLLYRRFLLFGYRPLQTFSQRRSSCSLLPVRSAKNCVWTVHVDIRSSNLTSRLYRRVINHSN